MEGNPMKGLLRRAAAAVCAAAICSVCAVSAFADHTFDLGDKGQTDEILADAKTVDGTQAQLTMDFGTDADSKKMISVRYVLFGEYLDTEFWNDPNVSVSIDVKLETEGANVMGYIPGFDTNWIWINPTEYTTLKYGEWMTITESGQHFYEGFKKNGANRILFQLRSQWGEPGQGVVTISVKDFRITGGSAQSVVTEPEEITTPEPEVTTTPETTTTAEPVIAPTESAEPVQSAESAESIESAQSAQTAESAENTESAESAEQAIAPAQSTTPQAPDTTVETQRTAPLASSIDYSQISLEQPDPSGSIAMVVLIVVGSAVVIVGIGVVVFIIWKKKKFY